MSAGRRLAELTDREVTATSAWCVWAPEHRGWWRPNRIGYTEDAAAAGIYSLDDAIAIWIDSRYADTPVPRAAALELMAALREKALGYVDRPGSRR